MLLIDRYFIISAAECGVSSAPDPRGLNDGGKCRVLEVEWPWQLHTLVVAERRKKGAVNICRGDVAGGCAAAGTLSLGRAREGQAVHRQKCPFGTAVVALRVYIAITGTVG